MKMSQKYGSKRLIKAAKLRYGSDENQKVYHLSLDPGSLWFADEGEVIEKDHMNIHEGKGRQTAEDKINFQAVFQKCSAQKWVSVTSFPTKQKTHFKLHFKLECSIVPP
jgi:hypothetical protein